MNYDYFRWRMFSSKRSMCPEANDRSLDHRQCSYRSRNHECSNTHLETDFNTTTREANPEVDLLCDTIGNYYMVCFTNKTLSFKHS